MKNKYRVIIIGDTVRVYSENHSDIYWLSFSIFGGSDLYCGHVSSCAGADSYIYAPKARRLALELLAK